MGSPEPGRIAGRSAVSAAVGFLDDVFMAFMFLYLVKDLAGPREKDMLYLFVGLMIIMPLLLWAIPRSFSSSDPLNMIKRIFYITAGWVLLKMGVILIALLAYWSIKKDMDVHGLGLPRERPAFLPRIRPLDTYIGKFYSKPVVALVVLLVVAMVLGGAVGAQLYSPKDKGGAGGSTSHGPVEPVEEVHSDAWGDSLGEGEAMVYNDSIEATVTYIEVRLIWSDESDYTLRTNEPDGFTLEVTAGGETLSDSGENPRNGEGNLVVTFNMDNEDPPYVEELEIVVTLEYCGDQQGPAGLGGPLTVTDDGNDFAIELVYSYYAE